MEQTPRPCFDQPNRLFFDQIQHFFKIVAFAVIRIRQGDVAEEEREAMVLFLRTTPAQFAQVDLVGGEDEIELVEIGGVHLTCAQGLQVITSGVRMSDRARVRGVADVVIFGACGIEFDAQARLLRFDAEHGFCGRRPADIAHADQKHPTGLTDLGHGSDLAAEALVVVQVQDVEPGDDILALGASRGRRLVLRELGPAGGGAGGSLLVIGGESGDFLA
jgi:hypothetical protein